MISKVSSVNPSFSGTCKIGKNREERSQIADVIKKIPKNNREEFVNLLKFTKNAIAANTAPDEKFTIHLTKYNSNYCRSGLYLDIEDNKRKIRTMRRDMPMTFERNRVPDSAFAENMRYVFVSAVNDVIHSVTPKKGAPTTKKEILDKLA